MRISEECRQVARLLSVQGRKLVLAESCTCGLIAASLGRVPGISNHFCGSLVTYRAASKTAWLKIPSAVVEESDAVTETVARMMVESALAMTPEADLGASITGHLGPDAPAGLDGRVFIGVARRKPDLVVTNVTQLQLTASSRIARQREATCLALVSIRQELLGG